MLQISIDEKIIDLSKGFSNIPLILKSTFLTNQSAFSFPFAIPNNLSNREKLGIVTNENNYTRLGNLSCRIKYNTFIIDGNIKIIDIGNNIELNFTGYESLIYSKMNTVKLTDIDESVAYTASDLFDSGQSSNDIYCCMPVNASTESNLGLSPIIWDKYILNYPDDTTLKRALLQGIPGGHPAEDYENKIESQVAPFFFLKYVIEKIFNLLGINIEENIIEDDSDLNKLLILYFSQKYFGGGLPGPPGGTLYFKDVLPQVSINEFLTELENRLGIKFILNPFKRSLKIIFFKDVILSTSKIDISDKVSKILNPGMIKSDNYYLRQNFISSDEFLTIDEFPDFIDVDTENTNDIEINVVSTSAKKSVNDDLYIKTEISGPDTYWYYRSANIAEIGYNINTSSQQSIPFPVLPWRLMFVQFGTEGHRFKIHAVTEVVTVLTDEPIAIGQFKLTKSLKWEDGGNGIYDLQYKPIIFWKNNLAKSITLTARFESDDLVNFDFLQKYQASGMDFLIEEIPVKLFLNKIKIGKIKAVTT